QYLPPGNYKLIYVERNIEEILDSMEKMMGAKDEEREDTKKAFIKLNNKAKAEIIEREDIEVLFVNYNEILSSPGEHIDEIFQFLQDKNLDLDKIIQSKENELI
ncbi:MAG: nucleotide pyrophosphatase, partial [Candidatus Hydrothermarchaeales archaeon]